MISLTLKNFMAFKEETHIPLGDLTVIAGVNSGGKSSIIKALLLLAQSFQEDDNSCARLVLNGKYKNIKFVDLLSKFDPEMPKEIYLDMEFDDSLEGNFDVFREFYSSTFLIDNPAFIPNRLIGRYKIKLNEFGEPEVQKISLLKVIKGIGVSELFLNLKNPGENNLYGEKKLKEIDFRFSPKANNIVNFKDVVVSVVEFLETNEIQLAAEDWGFIQKHYKNILEKWDNHEVINELDLMKINHDKWLNFGDLVWEDTVTGIKEIQSSNHEDKYKEISFIDIIDIYCRYFGFEEIEKLPGYQEVLPLISRINFTSDVSSKIYFGFSHIISLVLRFIFQNNIKMNWTEKLNSQFDQTFCFLGYEPEPDKWAIDNKNEPHFAGIMSENPDMKLIDVWRFKFDYLLSQFALGVRYLGPIRAEPKLIYPHQRNSEDIGTTGENIINILKKEKDRKIINMKNGERIEEPLFDAVNHWLKEFGGTLIRVSPIADYADNIEFETYPGSGIFIPINSVGFGFSQLLPIIVESLRFEENATLILEQPELHLHPGLQHKLADFLITMIQMGKRIIVETHSDHLINTLRLRMVQGTLDGDKVSMVFVKPHDETGNGSVVEKLKINQFGQIENWPKGFLDQAGDINVKLLKAIYERGNENVN